ncbi:Twinfilin-1 [Orchesella cincta]|uniref:Twinfilin n=1 Tax=Orchesella cincta TaxID=48709 RepID=A0A1D2MGJ2_ORCCI|nr:Twinfilin-1 [Orchesella cincta]
MSHQTGIKANEELVSFFGRCRDGGVRLVKINIENEELSLAEYSGPNSDAWEKDYESLIQPMLEESQPCYVLFRLDSKDNAGYNWLLFTWSPDNSPVRQKMLYASTKATLKNEFGAAQIKEEVFATSLEEATWEGYLKIKRNRDAPVPLTMAEEELAEIKRTEVHSEIGIDTKHQTLQGVLFPLTKNAYAALEKFRNKQLNYVQLKIEIDEEVIELASTADTNVQDLPKRVPGSHARYHLFNFPHTHEGDYVESLVFIYSMPGYNCSIKERMLYSSCKAPLIAAMENQIGLVMEKRMEIDSGTELTEDFLREEIHPTKSLNRPMFAKPKGPPNRGAKRLTKARDSSEAV